MCRRSGAISERYTTSWNSRTAVAKGRTRDLRDVVGAIGSVSETPREGRSREGGALSPDRPTKMFVPVASSRQAHEVCLSSHSWYAERMGSCGSCLRALL